MSSPLDELEFLTLGPNMPRIRGRGQRRSLGESARGHSSSDPESPTYSQGQQTLPRGPPPDPSLSPVSRQEREVEALDILSTFESTVLPSAYRPDEQATLSTVRSPPACVVQLDLQATILRLAVNVPPFFSTLRAAQPPASCAEIFFQKLRTRSTRLFEEWDIFCRYGPRGTQLRQTRASTAAAAAAAAATAASTVPATSQNTSPLTIPRVVHALRTITARLHSEILKRSPHGTQAAADCIFNLLTEVVVHRNRDAFADNTWNRRPARGEDEEDRNLFYQLIMAQDDENSESEESSDEDDNSDEDDVENRRLKLESRFFGLAALEALPTGILGERRQHLIAIRDRLEAARAPLAYRERFMNIIERTDAGRVSASGGASSSSGRQGEKRTAPQEVRRGGGKRGR